MKTHHSENYASDGFCKLADLPNSHCCAILESVSDGVFTVDLDKRITAFNPAAESITGFSAREAMGQYCFDIFRTDICATRCPLDLILINGKPQLITGASIITKTGQKKPISISTAGLKDSDGKVIGGVETFRDLSELEELRRQASRSFTHEDIVGRNPRIREILSLLPDIAESDSPVLIYGPTGSGKELFARAVHTLSSRKDGPFIPVNCAALPDTLLESELFGYAKGAFTGATRNKPGRFLLANEGTLFLDEICNTSMAFQTDLLRVLEDGEFIPLGDTRPLKANFRVVAATNLKLKELVREGKFREDPFFRLNVAKISLPCLKERKEDIPLLVEHFIHKFNMLKNKAIQGITPRALAYLLDYPFPGNIRELENIIEYAFIPCKDRLIDLAHLPADMDDVMEMPDGQSAHKAELHGNTEAQKLQALLQQYHGNRQQTAQAIGVSRTTLWRMIKKYGLAE
jgi:PAS domain S-box-containing protein